MDKWIGGELGMLFGHIVLAQFTVWGLSLFHVSSGYWGPFLLLLVLRGSIWAAVRSAITRDNE
jgi:hypothetical protein